MDPNALDGYVKKEESPAKWEKKGDDNRRDNRDTRNNNDNRNNNNRYDNNRRDNRDNSNRNDNRNNSGDKQQYSGGGNNTFNKRALYSIFNKPGGGIRSGKSSEDIRKLLRNGGLDEIITDLYKWRVKNEPRPEYAVNAIFDPLFVAAFNKKTLELLKEYDSGEKNLKKINVFYNEVNACLFRLKRDASKLDKNIYTTEIVQDMMTLYTKILLKGSNDIVKKITKKLEILTEDDAMAIAVLVAGGDPERSMYNLNNYLYHSVGSRSSVEGESSLSTKDIKKLYSLCYGDEKQEEIVLTLMLEKNIKSSLSRSVNASYTWSAIDEYLLKTFEDMPTKTISKILYKFAKKRQSQEQTGSVIRRLGDSRSIHSDDYPKLAGVFKDIEEDDITLKIWFRNR
jgi:hypothetical protein